MHTAQARHAQYAQLAATDVPAAAEKEHQDWHASTVVSAARLDVHATSVVEPAGGGERTGGGGSGGEGGGGGEVVSSLGGEGGAPRGPQSVQSVPSWQMANSAPGPPSSQ